MYKTMSYSLIISQSDSAPGIVITSSALNKSTAYEWKAAIKVDHL